METLLEQQRRYHEERERLMDATVKEMLQPSKPVSFLIRIEISTAFSHAHSIHIKQGLELKY